MKLYSIFIFLLAITTFTYSQEGEASYAEPDSSYVDEDFEDADKPDSFALPDTMKVATRDFDSETLGGLKSNPALQYEAAPTIAESLWNRFLLWLKQLIQAIFDNAVTTNWGRVFIYMLGIAVVVVLIMMILNVNAFKVFYSVHGGSTLKHTVLDENIHEMDFEKLIREATVKNDYRLGVRLVFLYALKILSDKNLIHWDLGKTNHDYLDELNAVDVKTGFNELNFYFEYAWYGNFKINQEMFSNVQLIFNEWKGKLG